MTFARGRNRLIMAMAAAVAAVVALVCLDEVRESEAALDDFAEAQALLARSVAASVAGTSPDPFSSARALERPNALAVWFLPPGATDLVSPDGRRLSFPPLVAALEGASASLRLNRDEAATVGLSRRTAFAGLARVPSAGSGRWGVAVVATAEHLRDRDSRARTRLILSVVLATGLVVAFGGFALRTQRKELSLARELAVAEVERDRDEKLARLSQAATTMTLASGMAHELSTPLGAIVGRAEQLRSAVGGDERAKRAVQTILDQSERMSQVIRGFLNLARGGAPSMATVSPLVVVKGALALVEHRFAKKGVSIELSVPDGLAAIRCDPPLLEHALVNLLLNAADACKPGGRVQVNAKAEGGLLAFIVTDNGAGISAEHAARVTEPFFTTKPVGEGTGLGLAITNEIVKSHRGALIIAPAHPLGTCVTLQIPLASGSSDASA